MKKILFFLMVLSTLSYADDVSNPIVKRVFFENHSYVCFDGKTYLHDPDCRCDNEWVGYIKDPQGDIVNAIFLFRKQVYSHD